MLPQRVPDDAVPDTMELPIPDELVGEATGVEALQGSGQGDEALLPADGADGGLVDNQALTEVQAAGVLPSALFDLDETGWASFREMSSSKFADHFESMKDDYMMLDVEIDIIGGEYKAGAVWQRNDTNRGWAEYRNLDTNEFHDKWVELKDQGYRLVDQESYVWNGERLYAGVWVDNVEGYGWASWRNLTSAEFSDKFAEYQDQYLMVDVEAYPTGNGLRYAMIWVRNVENLDWIERRNLTDQQFSDEFQQNRGAYRVWDIESYRSNGTQYYAVIWLKNENGRGWAEYRDMTATGYRNRWYRMRDLGYRLIDFEMYESGNGTRYAGAWRQNTDRPDWALRNQVDDLAKAYYNDNNLPGIGVAIASGNEIKYVRGFGHQDVDDNVWYSARTINGLASVSKAVGGILAMNMLQDGTLTDLDTDSSQLIPGLPAHHSHTVRQLIANRSGIGHYEDHTEPIAEHATALAAAQDFWDEPLVYTPGAGCKYSTHAYTFLGAALEGAGGKSIAQLVEDELAGPFGLTTLKLEDVGSGNGNRATRYNGSNDPVSISNSSWKVLGGGLEASAYDMVRLGMRVVNGTAMNAASLAEMQTVPEPTPCDTPENQSNYALGWNVGTHMGTAVMRKGGSWTGADTNIRIYPDREIVIVVLTNRTEDHNSGDLAIALGSLLLDNEPAGADAGGMEFDGASHTPMGQVHAFRVEGGLHLTDFGTDGEGGIRMQAPEGTLLWKSKLSLDVGMRSRAAMTAQFRALVGELVDSRLSFTGGSEGLGIQAFSGRSAHQIQFIHQGQLVGTGDGTQAAMIDWDEIFCIMNLPSGVPSEICDIWISYQTNQSGQNEWNIALPTPVMLQNGGEALTVDRIRLIEENAAVQAAATTALSQIEIRASSIESITLHEHATADAPEATDPEIVDPGPETVYLPLVVNQ